MGREARLLSAGTGPRTHLEASPDGARLVPVRVDPGACAGVIVLHGGAARGAAMPVSATQLSVLRMKPIAHRIARATGGRLAVWRLLNSRRGWDSTVTPVDDATWALDRVREQIGDSSVGLVGHSLGGRAALWTGAHPRVHAVVALNAWLYPDDRPPLVGRSVLLVHGTADRIAPLTRARSLARRLSATNAVDLVEVPDGRHAMLRQQRAFLDPVLDLLERDLLGPR